jgi:MFS family permease
MRVAVLLAFTQFVPVGMYDALWSRYLADRGASTLFIGLSLTLFSVPFGALATVGGRVADRFGAFPVAVVFLAATVPLTVAYGILRHPMAVVIAALLESVLQAVVVPATLANLAHAAPPGRAAAAQGLGGAAGLLGAASLSLAAAPIYGATTHWVVFTVTASLVSGLLVVTTLLHRGLGGATASPVS